MILHYLKMAVRSLMRNKTQNIISMAGLVFSLTCVFILVRYVHQEYTVNHFIPEWERTFYMTVVDDGETHLSSSSDPNNEPGFKSPVDNPAVETYSRFMLIDNDIIEVDKMNVPVNVLVVDDMFFNLMPYPCIEGTSTIQPDDALISEKMARRLFGTEIPVGKTIKVSTGKMVRIVGVLGQPSSKSSLDFDIVLSAKHDRWLKRPIEIVRLYKADNLDLFNENNSVPVKLKLYTDRPVYFQLASLEDVYFDKNIKVYQNNFIRGNKDAVHIYILIALLILLVGIFNYVNLYTAIVQQRIKELSVKKIFGAGKLQVFSQLYVENIVFNLITLFFVWLFVEITHDIISNIYDIPVQSDKVFDIIISFIVILFLPLVVLVYPYFKLSYNVPVESLRIMGVGANSLFSRFAFLFMQYVITFVLIVSSIYFSSQLYFLYNTDVGYRTENVLRCTIFRQKHTYGRIVDDINKILSMYTEIERKVNESSLFTGMTFGSKPYNIESDIDFKNSNGDIVKSLYLFCSKEYMDFFGFKVVEGRGWNKDDDNYQCKMIVNRAFLKSFEVKDWKTEKIMPKNYVLWSSKSQEIIPYEIVGIMEDFRTGHLSGLNTPMAFMFMEGGIPVNDIFISFSEGKEKEALAYLQDLYNETVGEGGFEYSFIEDDIKKLHEDDRKLMMLVITFAVIAVVISCMGLFGLSLFDIHLRYREIGLRKINGAKAVDIFSLIMKKYFYTLAVAFVAGSALAYIFIENYMESYAHRVSLSVWMFLVSGILVSVIVFITLYWQTNKAARINPAEVIKSE